MCINIQSWKMAFTLDEGIVAHAYSASDTNESVSVTEKIVEGNEKSKIGSVFIGNY